MLLQTIAPGANLFIIIVAVLVAAGAGLTATDFLRTKAREKEWEKAEEDQGNQAPAVEHQPSAPSEPSESSQDSEAADPS